MLDRNPWNYLTVCKQMSSGLFKMLVTNYLFINPTFKVCVCVCVCDIYISTDSFILSQVINVARHAGRFELGLKPA